MSRFERTYAQLLKQASSKLERLGVPNFEQEAWWVLSFAADWENARLAAELPRLAPASAGKKVEEIILQRRGGRPLAYITGETEFYGLKFKISPAVLIPRPETEVLVEKCVQSLFEKKGKDYPVSILDVGTGSGCIALALLSRLPQARAVATDISKEALWVAKKNARSLGLEKRIQFVRGNLLRPLKAPERFDLIVSNPPYVSPDEFSNLASSVRNFEPRLALESPNGGTWFHAQIATQAARALKSGGLLALEVGENQAGEVSEWIRKTDSYQEPTAFIDLFGVVRIVMAEKK
ncbi:MAG: peptide chain release factor N(5)-glutamine methyltransferase [candidate division Zixibacteria bacterium]|nr:peptide chain release factor N(5)-glutamine methyltransferase [candidate division Zixibacteria bacterium]